MDKVYFQLFYVDKVYRIEYDAPHYIVDATDVVSFIWKQSVQLSQCEQLIKYAHFAIGGCVLSMDRIYENYRFNR